jgi:hypothetical protein
MTTWVRKCMVTELSERVFTECMSTRPDCDTPGTIVFMVLQLFVRPSLLFQFLDLLHRRVYRVDGRTS